MSPELILTILSSITVVLYLFLLGALVIWSTSSRSTPFLLISSTVLTILSSIAFYASFVFLWYRFDAYSLLLFAFLSHSTFINMLILFKRRLSLDLLPTASLGVIPHLIIISTTFFSVLSVFSLNYNIPPFFGAHPISPYYTPFEKLALEIGLWILIPFFLPMIDTLQCLWMLCEATKLEVKKKGKTVGILEKTESGWKEKKRRKKKDEEKKENDILQMV